MQYGAQEGFPKGRYMLGLSDALKQAQKNKVAIGHFNIADLVLLKAVFESGQELKVPVLGKVGFLSGVCPRASASSWASGKSPRWCEACGRNTAVRSSSTQITRTPSRRPRKRPGQGLIPLC